MLIADDERAIRESLRLLINAEPDMRVVADASNGASALSLVDAHRPDVILMDVQMPRMDGLEATRSLGVRRDSHAPQCPRVIVLTTFDLDEYVFEALRAGASGFLLKNSPPSELLRAIRVAHEGNALLAPEVTKRLIGQFSSRQADASVSSLTDRERETLVLVGRGLSNAEIAAALFVTVTTVRTYVSRILTKLDSRDRAGLVVVAYENGLVGLGSPAL
ncbi:response regulator transcription factor [Microbacterium sp. WCS2018Hpa-23]|uniref:response regulator transcription factor n=1 Tax=Microbacterium sp. WCS2018Hpa-23 TaxID=3073634 RepID=UPI0028834A88|nr:response regulator transcription factor [Microbacterium sp. WCS2018Hpa-23]